MQLHSRRLHPDACVSVDAPARLHLGFLDPNASLGRAFGSLGLMIDGAGTRVEARLPGHDHAGHDQIEGAVSEAERERIAICLERLHAAFDPTPVAIEVLRTPRAHSGLGSGTQLALAVGAAFARLLGHAVSSAELAGLLGRGARSGIGVLGFESGGLLVDGGPPAGLHAGVPPLLARQAFPDNWRVLLVSDTSREGLHGAEERRGLATLAPFPQALAAHLCHLVLMKILPGAAERDIVPFAEGLTQMQQTIGEYFAPVQGGVFASPAVEHALRAVAAQRTAGIGQSSWGPTGFAILASARDAEAALATAREATRGMPQIECTVVAGLNRGATVRAVEARQHQRIDAA
ncbi:beta-ribofuranosylaminobenzene 5'-phosphate synthase family protein [Paraburkholderia sp. DHOC27]|uniref:beta-ribofuranosylaminobenzene 5'-phosphate synthase family protein n=1 Tax=Paraburkholderia sp. DHOC27 TaxID=2303330 RepID=UPI000E3EAF1C|nr:beta-ribofuranosylaminobenzene 5'-phosphate synthase family protein [Paraburkholderia sp. DHOC27]RFU49350.1 beta-ribofuranosylaminobenzene 5'-phosphate synthase [Paraburkholderia sp. DHOC27]